MRANTYRMLAPLARNARSWPTPTPTRAPQVQLACCMAARLVVCAALYVAAGAAAVASSGCGFVRSKGAAAVQVTSSGCCGSVRSKGAAAVPVAGCARAVEDDSTRSARWNGSCEVCP